MRRTTALLMAALMVLAFPAGAKPVAYSWKTVPLGGGGYVDGFLYHPNTEGLLYARTDVGGSYRLDQKSNRWIPLMDGFGKDDWDCFGNLSLAVDPNHAEWLYATCGLYLGKQVPDAGFIRSDDQGRTWTKTKLPFKLGGNALGRGTGERLVVDPANSDHILLGTNRDGLWDSHDRGKSFQRVAGYPDAGVTFLLYAGDKLYAGSGANLSEWTGSGGGGILVSSDDGASFKVLPGAPKLIPHQAAVDADGNLYITFADGLGPFGISNGAVYKLTSDGQWSDISPDTPTAARPFGYAGLDLQKGVLAVSTTNRYSVGDDIYISLDFGVTWKAVGIQAQHRSDAYPWLSAYQGGHDKDATARRNMGHWMDGLKINPFDTNELIYGTGYGVWRTHNLSDLQAGKPVVLDFDDANLEETVVLGLESPSAGPRLLMAAGDIGGTAFDDLSKSPAAGLFLPMNKTNQSVAFAALKPKIIVRAAETNEAGAYISYDGSMTWTPLPGLPEPIADKDWHKHRAGKLVISAGATSMVWVPEGAAAYVSRDMGKTWVESAGWPEPKRGQEAISDQGGDGLFYAWDGDAGTVLITDDAGTGFKPWRTGLPHGNAQLRAVPGRTHDLWLATGTALFHLNGKAPVAVTGVEAWQVTFGKAAPGAKYPAVYVWGKVRGEEGLWRSTNEARTWRRINTDATRFGQMRAIAGDPRRFGVLYISPDGRGTLIGQPAHKQETP